MWVKTTSLHHWIRLFHLERLILSIFIPLAAGDCQGFAAPFARRKIFRSASSLRGVRRRFTEGRQSKQARIKAIGIQSLLFSGRKPFLTGCGPVS